MIALLRTTFQSPLPQNPHSIRKRSQFSNVCRSAKRQLERPKATSFDGSQSTGWGRYALGYRNS